MLKLKYIDYQIFQFKTIATEDEYKSMPGGYIDRRFLINLSNNKLENKSDNVYDKAVSELFENETDAKNIIKYKEVLSALESALKPPLSSLINVMSLS